MLICRGLPELADVIRKRHSGRLAQHGGLDAAQDVVDLRLLEPLDVVELVRPDVEAERVQPLRAVVRQRPADRGEKERGIGWKALSNTSQIARSQDLAAENQKEAQWKLPISYDPKGCIYAEHHSLSNSFAAHALRRGP